MKQSRTPVVYLIAQPRPSKTRGPINLAALNTFGQVRVILPMGDNASLNPEQSWSLVDERFRDFDPDIDYLVWAGGDMLAAVMIGMLLAGDHIYAFNWLRYERNRTNDGTRTDTGGKYVAVRVDLEEPSYTDDIHDAARS